MTTTITTDLSVKTNQGAFNAVVRHLAKMTKGRSLNENGACSYRGRDGNMCAVGALITDDYLARCRDRQDDSSIRSLVENEQINIGNVDVDLLQALQNTHDISASWHGARFTDYAKLRTIARKWGLKTNVLDKVEAGRK